VQYIDIVTKNIICVILRESKSMHIKKGKPRTAVQSIGPQTKLYQCEDL
jgi:hypothetical protein